jgi:histidyl-tRNA synthetase
LRDSGKLSSKICEKGLRYDLTVPFARFVTQHRDEIIFPFKRYQIQPVWRADRPQKGRYREFFQCDADVIGSDSLLNEYELLRVIDEVFVNLRLPIIIKINNRKILAGIAEYIGENSKITDITVAIDKIEKIGLDAVNDELRTRGLSNAAIEKLQPILLLKGSNEEKLFSVETLLAQSEIGMKGVEELRTIFEYVATADMKASIELDLTLARGLNYYTGAIIEVKSADVAIGSICGGGRYDNLTGVFGMEGVSGVGISFGADRIYDVLKQADKFSDIETASSEALVVNFGGQTTQYALKIVERLRGLSIKSELYPDAVKLKKQLAYADAKKIPYIIMAGDDEVSKNAMTIKNMTSGEQELVSFEKLESYSANQFKKNVKSKN